MKKWLHAAFCIALASQVVAQTEPSPEATLLAYTEATRAYDPPLMSRFMHPEALRRFRTTIDAAGHRPNSST